jgi:hypothetical protein
VSSRDIPDAPRRRGDASLFGIAAGVIVGVFVLIYLPDIGHGFISDDFRWIVESRVTSIADAAALFTTNVGFYRPVTSLSFAMDGALWGGGAFGYGVTNGTLCLAVAAMLFALARQLGLPAPASLLAAGVWLLNFHAINMAVLWLSGRTALLAALFSLASAWTVLRRRPVAGGMLALAAMLSKEEAIALPVLLTLDRILFERRVGGVRMLVPLWVALLVYLALRLQSGAFWPADAPSFYQFSPAPSIVGRNVLEYGDRAGTVFAAVAVLLITVTRSGWRASWERERRVLGFAVLWVAAMYALTVFLPVRSSLYALLPSLGSALALGAFAAAGQRRDPLRFRRAVIGLLVAAVVLVPVYRARNVRWVAVAELSERVLRTVAADVGRRAMGHIVLIDAPDERFNLTAAFGNLFPEALALRIGGGWTGEIVMSPESASRPATLTYRLASGIIERTAGDRPE